MSRAARTSLVLAVVVIVMAGATFALWQRLAPEDRDREVMPAPALPPLSTLEWIEGAAPAPRIGSGAIVVLVVVTDADPLADATLRTADAWHDAYARWGVKVVGVHAPEFAFASDTAATARWAQRLGLEFPVALDRSLAIEHQLGGVGSAPRVVVFDRAGRVLVNRADPTAVTAAEYAIRRAVRAARPDVALPGVESTTPDPSPPPSYPLRVHLGVGRPSSGPLADAIPGRVQVFTAQFRHQVEGAPWVPYPVGRWMPLGDGVLSSAGGAANFVAIRYDAGAIGVVASPPPNGPGKLWVLRDERWLDPASFDQDTRLDPSGASYLEIVEPRLYRIARGGGEHVIKLSPEQPGVTLHAFTFEPPAARGRH